MEQWVGFKTFLMVFIILNLSLDALAWNLNQNGLFTVSFFRRNLEGISDGSSSIQKVVWNGVCPSKVEVFLWQLYKGKVLVREVLQRFGMGHLTMMECLLCSQETETVDHLFLHCPWTYKLWKVCLDWWDVSWCSNKTIHEWFDGWMGLCPTVKSERAWLSLLSVVVWTVCEVRNQKVFKDKTPSLTMAQDSIGFQIAWWFKFLGKNVSDSVSALMLNLKHCCVETRRVKKSVIKDWVPPLMNTFKFNVDGSARGNLGQTGIGGVLRDYNGMTLPRSSVQIPNTMDSNAAEITSIHKTIEICSSSPSLHGQVVSIVSDSKVAVSWIKNEDFGSIEHILSACFLYVYLC
ncbi:hypothetical protein Dsin_003499 [Dipteronia sinensis]|uniref:Reverse transcriptase zinc-binding domain-containing protein n=1 Tax=Dipteronia sinensis TaxID=43782 RepID=A0AAE0B921_9ROSI|nr:hypothetical protein Dsin_003499 [Dipteronia sinensis]